MTLRHPEYLISPEALAASLQAPDLVILDATTTLVPNASGTFDIVTGLTAFEQGHIPGAQYVDLERDLSRPVEGLLFTLPDVDAFAQAASRLGIGAHSRVVVYSHAQPGWAARVWLMLRAFGFTQAQVLDGGLHAWKAAGLPLESGPARTRPAPAQPYPWVDDKASWFVDTPRVEQALAQGDAVLINALGRDYFAGQGNIAYGRKGHIPGSVNLPTAELAGADGRYLPAEAMQALYDAAQVPDDADVIAYCGAGVAGSNVAFGRLLLGHAHTRVYDGSLMEWTQDPSRPMNP